MSLPAEATYQDRQSNVVGALMVGHDRIGGLACESGSKLPHSKALRAF